MTKKRRKSASIENQSVVIRRIPKLAAKLKRVFLRKTQLKHKIRKPETEQERIKRLAQRALETNAWINELIDKNRQAATAMLKYVQHHNPEHRDLFGANAPPWHKQLIDIVRDAIEKRYAPPLKLKVQAIDTAQFEMIYWNKCAFPLMDEVLGRYLTEKFVPTSQKSQIHKKIDVIYGASLLPAAYRTFGIQEHEIFLLEHTIRKVRFLGKIRENAVKDPLNEWKPHAFSFYQENLLKKFWVEDPLAEMDWLDQALLQKSSADSRGMLTRNIKTETMNMSKCDSDKQKPSKGNRNLSVVTAPAVLRLARNGADGQQTGSVNDRLWKVLKGRGKSHKIVSKGFQSSRMNWEAKCLELDHYDMDSPEIFWRQLLQEWAVGCGYETLLTDCMESNNPQPVEVIEQIASVRGIERLRGVLATLLPTPPSTERAQGFFLLLNKVHYQTEKWKLAFGEMMRVVEVVASADTFRAVRFAATIITCCRNDRIPAPLEKETCKMFRSSSFVNRWAACHLLVKNHAYDPDVIHEIISLLFDYVKMPVFRDRLVRLLQQCPLNTSTLIERILARLNSANPNDRRLACTIIPSLTNQSEGAVLSNWSEVKVKVIALALEDENDKVRFEAIWCIKREEWSADFLNYLSELVKHKPDKLTAKLEILRKWKNSGGMCNPNVEGELVQYLKDDSPSVRLAALDAANSVSDRTDESAMVPLFLKLAQFDHSDAVRYAALNALILRLQSDLFRSSILDCLMRMVRCDHALTFKTSAFAALIKNDLSRTRISDLHGHINGLRFSETDKALLAFYEKASYEIEEAIPGIEKYTNALRDNLKTEQDKIIETLNQKLDFHERAEKNYSMDCLTDTQVQAWKNLKFFSHFVEKF